MGSNVQEIFQGGGDQKGQGLVVTRAVPILLLVSAYVCLLFELPVSMPMLWFPVGISAAAVYTFLHFRSGRKDRTIEFLFSLALLAAGLIEASGYGRLKAAYLPAVVCAAYFYGRNEVMVLSLLIPLLGARKMWTAGIGSYETAIYAAVAASGATAAYFFGRLKSEKEKAEDSLSNIKDNARKIALDTDMESLGSDELMSHYFATLLKTDEELRELLQAIKSAVFADSASLFVPYAGNFALRCSTEQSDDINPMGKGVLSLCLSEKKTVMAGEMKEKGLQPGYIRNGRISSIVAAPLLDGGSPIGVLAVDSSRYRAFSENDKNTVEMFAGYFIKILERERIYFMIKRDIFSLRILKEESYNLVSSLQTEVIVEKFCDGAGKIAPADVYFFISRGRGFELIHQSGGPSAERKLYDFKGTFLNMAAENRQPMFVSHVSDYRIPVMPFKTQSAASILVVPMLYEKNLLGLFVMLSAKKNFLDALQIDLIKVMCNQASTSIANAMLHSEIERMATTDGLTGLFNHRLFQEKLSDEIRRIKRSGNAVSVMLTDIDFFKKINDTYGHPVGDQVLKTVARVIREAIREIDIPARYGGEEFAVILPGTEGEGARNIAERLRKMVSEKTFTANGRNFKITISIGIAGMPADAKTKEDLIDRADKALYHAKHNGRNQSVLWSSIK